MKIKLNKHWPLARKRILLTIMRTFIFLLCTTVFSLSPTSSFSQRKIKIKTERVVSVNEVFNIIEQQTDYRFIYPQDLFTNASKIQLRKGKIKITNLLKTCLLGSKLDFKLSDKNIIEIVEHKKIKQIPSQKELQKFTVKGTVNDSNGQPLPGANVLEKGSTNGAQTDFDGNFSLTVSDENATLVVSYIGFLTQEVALSGKTSLVITLQEDAAKLDEIVLVGYGSVRKGDVSTSVGVVNADELADQLTTGFDQAMTGKVAGVQVLQTSGSPGGNISIRVRGTASISAGNDPLYVIDGVPLSNDTKFAGGKTSQYETPTNPLNSINTNDIESIQILKDAAATAIYGSRGSNGVVLITTKKGKSGKLKVSYNMNVGFQSVTKKIDLLDAYQYSQLTYEARNNTYQDYLNKNSLSGSSSDSNTIRTANGAPAASLIPHQILPYLNGQAGLTNTDWQDEIFRTGLLKSHTLSFSGGSDKVRYFVSGNYLDQEGVVISSGFKKYSTRLNLDVKSGKFHAGLNLTPTYSVTDKVNSEGRYADEGVIALALGYAPIFPVYNPDGTYNFDGNGNKKSWGQYSQSGQLNPVAVANLTQDELSQFNFLGNAFFEYELSEGLTYKLSLGADINNFRRDYYRPSSLERRFQGGPSIPRGYSSTDQFVNWVAENTLSYINQIGEDHDINAVVGYTVQKNRFNSNYLESSNFPNDLVTTLNAGTVTGGGSRTEEYSLLSYLARVQYGFKNKYILSASMRADGSSRFGPNTKWGYFPSVSGAWKVMNESFLEDSNVINDLKLRASYGVTGNFDIGNYSSQGLLGQSNYNSISGLAPITASNEELTWERSFSTNFGLNLGLFDNKVTLEVDHYISNTEDLLLQLPVSTISGFSSSLQNIGRVQNKGWEFLLGFKNHDHDLKWNVNFNIATNKNEVKELGPNNEPIIVRGGAYNFFITRVGDPIGSYYTLKTDGIFETQEELDSSPHFSGAQVGDLKFVDVSGDGAITQGGDASQDDRTITGNYNPDYTFGIGGSLSYKNLDFGFNIQGSQGNEVMNILSRYINNVEGNFNNRTDVLDRWVSPTNTGNGTIYRANRVATGRNGWTSDWHVEDGSYIRLQNVSLGYTFPDDVLEKFKLDRLRISLTGQNLFTITKYSGYNPEVNGRFNTGGLNNTSPGEDYGTYPLAKTISLGLNVSF